MRTALEQRYQVMSAPIQNLYSPFDLQLQHTPRRAPMASSHRSAGHKYEGNVAGENARVHYGDVYNLPPGKSRDIRSDPQRTNRNTTSDRHEAPSGPISTVPFPRDPDHVHRGPLVDDICEKLSVPAARVALVGLGGVG